MFSVHPPFKVNGVAADLGDGGTGTSRFVEGMEIWGFMVRDRMGLALGGIDNCSCKNMERFGLNDEAFDICLIL